MMTILSYGTTTGNIDILWFIMVFIFSFAGLGALVDIFIDMFSIKKLALLLVSAVIVTVGILGFTFWTPHYNTLKVYNDSNFSMEKASVKYDITGSDGYIIYLREKQPFN